MHPYRVFWPLPGRSALQKFDSWIPSRRGHRKSGFQNVCFYNMYGLECMFWAQAPTCNWRQQIHFYREKWHRESYDKIRASELPPAIAIFIVKKRGVLSFFRTLSPTCASPDAPLSCFVPLLFFVLEQIVFCSVHPYRTLSTFSIKINNPHAF